MDDPRPYIEKRNALIAAQETMDEIWFDLDAAQRAIEKCDLVLLPTEVNLEFSHQKSKEGRPIKEWPTYDRFVQALRSWRHARHEAQQAYKALTDHAGLAPLPALPSDRPGTVIPTSRASR